jgi:hypothetical protein
MTFQSTESPIVFRQQEPQSPLPLPLRLYKQKPALLNTRDAGFAIPSMSFDVVAEPLSLRPARPPIRLTTPTGN